MSLQYVCLKGNKIRVCFFLIHGKFLQKYYVQEVQNFNILLFFLMYILYFSMSKKKNAFTKKRARNSDFVLKKKKKIATSNTVYNHSRLIYFDFTHIYLNFIDIDIDNFIRRLFGKSFFCL